MIFKKFVKNGIHILYVKKDKTDHSMDLIKNTLLKKNNNIINCIISENTDVYIIEDNKKLKLLLKFRKNELKNHKIFYENIINFAKTSYSTNRGSASGSLKKNVSDNPRVYSNILGYIDNFSPKQKSLIKKNNIKIDYNVRPCRFNIDYPDKFKNLIPFINEIDKLYKNLLPNYYKKQIKKAKETYYRISKTSFTTITTNVNFQTSIHKDTGDDMEGFGNLSVIENGNYTGGETCFPQFGIGVNIRTGDILFMDVHEWHCNLPIIKKTNDAIRLSIVCYLRYNVWKYTKGVSKEKMIEQNNKIIKMRKS